MAQRKLYGAEAEVEARNWEQRNSDFASQEMNQEFESQRFQLHEEGRWADQAQRDKISMYAELELRNGLFQENHARDCQQIEELRSSCCEDVDRTRRVKSDELSMQQERNPTTVSQMMAQIRELQNNVNSLSDARENFRILNQETALERPTFPIKTSTILSSRTLPRCDSGLPRNTQNCSGLMGNVFE